MQGRMDWSKLGPVRKCFGLDTKSEQEMLEALDPGIRRIVQILRENGIETYESCQGGPGHSYPEPVVRFSGEFGHGYMAMAVAIMYQLPIFALRRTWYITHGELIGPNWEMIFILPSMTTGTGREHHPTL